VYWQDGLARPEHLPPGGTPEDALRFLRYLASQARLQEIHFLWRPFLADADDDLVLELASAAGCRHIVTHNVNDSGPATIPPRPNTKRFGLTMP
jgi:hypothetical protein